MLWGQRVSLGHKRAVCLQLKSVIPFSVLMDQSASSWLCCRPSTGCWLTAVFRSAAPSPPLGTLQQHSPSGHFHSLALKLLQGACGARGRPCRAIVLGDSGRGLFWRVSEGLSAASLAILRLHPRVSVCRAWGSTDARVPLHPWNPPDPTHGSPHTAQLPPFTDRAGACARRAHRPANPRGLRHQRSPPRPAPQQWIS